MHRSLSNPNVGVRPTEQHVQRPRRTKTSLDFLAAPHRNAINREQHVDPFILASFFPAGLRRSNEEPSGWWRDEGPEEGSDELARELMDSDSNPPGPQRVLFYREDSSSEVVKRQDKPGVLTILTGVQPSWADGTEACLHSPYLTDEACDDEALRLAYERRRYQPSGGSSGQFPEKSKSLFYEGEEGEEAAGWFGLMMM